MLTTRFANYLSTSADIEQWAKPIGHLWTQEDHIFPSLASKTESFWKSFIQHYLQSHYCRWASFTIYFGQCQFYFYHLQVEFLIIIWPQVFSRLHLSTPLQTPCIPIHHRIQLLIIFCILEFLFFVQFPFSDKISYLFMHLDHIFINHLNILYITSSNSYISCFIVC